MNKIDKRCWNVRIFSPKKIAAKIQENIGSANLITNSLNSSSCFTTVHIPYKYKKILPALKDVEQHYFENKKISYYADLCYMSEPNFRKLLKEYTGSSFIEYRNTIRITKAKEMIESGEYKVAEATYLVGFNNMSFFYKIFRKH